MSSKNPFALLNDSDDDDEAAPQQTAPKAAAKPEVKKPAEPKPAPKKAPAKTEAGKDQETPSYGAGDRGGRGGRGGGTGDRGGRGGSRAPREGKREFDRHSGTGRPPTEMKRGGAGRHNWGAEGDQGDAEFAGEPGEETEEMKARREEREKEDKQMTFEEYQNKIAGSKGAFAAKAVSRSEDIKGEALVRPDDDEGYTGKQGKFRTKTKKADTNSFDKSMLGFQAPAHEVDSGKGGKGGKGYGGRGGGKKGGDRGGRGKSGGDSAGMTVDFQDSNAFPSLY